MAKLAPSHVLVDNLYAFFGKTSIQFLYSFLNFLSYFLLLSCISSLYVLNINPFLDMSLANILSLSVGCLFILLMVFFSEQRLLNVQAYLTLLCFILLHFIDIVFFTNWRFVGSFLFSVSIIGFWFEVTIMLTYLSSLL